MINLSPISIACDGDRELYYILHFFLIHLNILLIHIYNKS
jgi:hypothetical protein